MDFQEKANEFVGSTLFSVIMIIAVIVIGIILRMTFRSSDSEYKHKSDSE